MPYMTTGERIGFDLGKLEGRVEGRLEGELSMVLRLLLSSVGATFTKSTRALLSH